MTFLVTALAFYLVWTFVQCYNQRDRLFLNQNTSADGTDPVLVATWKDGDIPMGCEIITDKEVIDNVVSSSDSSKIRNLSENDMKLLLDDCSQFNSTGEKMKSAVEASTRMPLRDIISNSYQGLRRRNGEASTSQKQRQGRRNNYRNNDTRVNGIETTTSLNDLKSSRRKNASTTTIDRNSTKAPRSAIERNPARETASRTTIDRYSTKPAIVRNSTRRTTIDRYSTEPTGNAIERNPARRATNGRYPTESTTRRISTARGATGRARSINRTTTTENNLETSTIATSSSTTPGYNGIPIILPSTKWCGAGDIAQDDKDLGRSEDTDKCCRAHDHCNDTLAPGETRGNLTNDSSFTLLNCQCDEEFYDCLDGSNSIISNTVGNLYFNILGRKCYKKDYPLVCKRYYTFFKITCREYESDTSEKRDYNWYPAKRYRKIFTK